MKKELITLPFEGKEVRTKLIDGEPWFVAKDVCEVLGILNHRDAISYLDEDEKGVGKIYTLGGVQEMVIINESGLYTLVVRSNKEEAKRFRKWVTGEVLPSIRKYGYYKSKYSHPLPVLSTEEREMLELIKENLVFGDKMKIAKDLGVHYSIITRILNGNGKREDVIKRALVYSNKNKDERGFGRYDRRLVIEVFEKLKKD